MRVKIQATEFGFPKLVFGKEYYMAYAGVTYGENFIFTRKNRIELIEYTGERKVASRWVSKKELKQLLASGCIHWMGPMDGLQAD